MNMRQITQDDLVTLENIAAQMGTHHEAGYFQRCLDEQAAGKRALFMAPDNAGYVQLNWQPVYAPFRRLDIPEIQDLNVIPSARRSGIGKALVLHCLDIARRAGRTTVGISVGIDASYGQAQRLYARLGFIPDGAGVAFDDAPARLGDMRAIDGLLTLKMTKDL